MITTALKIRVNYSEIMFLLYMKILYEIIDYAQKFEHAKWDEKIINSMILIKNDKTWWWSEYKLSFNELIMTEFILSDRCW